MPCLFRASYKCKKTGKTLKSKKWYGQLVDAEGKTCRVPLSANKSAAQTMLTELVRKAELAKAGVHDAYEDHRKKPLTTHRDDWLGVLQARGRGEEYIGLKKARVDAILDGCAFAFTSNLAAEKLERFLETLRTGTKKLSVQTTNDYLQAISQFCNWMVENERLERNPFVSIKKGNAERDRRHVRRVLTEQELTRLVTTTRAGQPLKRLTGNERAMLYTVAACTGYRAGELAALTPRCFNLDDSPASINLDGAFTKNGKPACQPIPSSLVAELRTFLVGRTATAPVWPGWWAGRAAEMIVEDATAASVALTVDTKDGTQVLDFHSLRGTFATFLDGLDTSLKARQVLMRHTDPRLTMNRYTRATLGDLAKAVEQLPNVLPVSPAVADPTPVTQSACTNLALTTAGSCGSERVIAGVDSKATDGAGNENRQQNTAFAGDLAERAGFEPAVGFYPHAALAKLHTEGRTTESDRLCSEEEKRLARQLAQYPSLDNPDIAKIAAAWPTLSAKLRVKILALIASALPPS